AQQRNVVRRILEKWQKRLNAVPLFWSTHLRKILLFQVLPHNLSESEVGGLQVVKMVEEVVVSPVNLSVKVIQAQGKVCREIVSEQSLRFSFVKKHQVC